MLTESVFREITVGSGAVEAALLAVWLELFEVCSLRKFSGLHQLLPTEAQDSQGKLNNSKT